MPDREKVIKGLECCMKWTGEPNTATCHCSDCSYTNIDILGERCLIDLINDALALLKEQEAIEAKQGEWIYCEDASGQDGYKCSECGFFEPWYYDFENHNFITDYAYCPSCGRSLQEGR